jgi:predicted O-methyltransferase YrrM
MYSLPQLVFRYFNYYLKASNSKGHGAHSPFIYDFIKTVLNDRQHYPAYDTVEKLRQEMLKDQTLLTVQDFGAGSSVDRGMEKSIASIAKNSAKPKKYGQLLYRMVKKYQPQTILELGTSLGITSAYMALARPEARLVTLEGAAAIAAIARQNFNKLQLQNIELREGNFDDSLTPVIRQLPSVNFAFIDGNHRREPTISYFQQLLSRREKQSIFVFDDIHWSREMEQAWESIKADTQVRCTIDLFYIGIVFFREEFREKQNFVIRF